jgi:hypothetical protein
MINVQFKITIMTKTTVLILYFFIFIVSSALSQQKIEHVIIVTTDGLRWQDVFTGMDAEIADNKKFNQDKKEAILKQYWHDDATERRKKLLPFLWNTIATKGQLYGNRLFDNKVDNANPYWFSYPGYNEIFTGYPDTAINSNSYKNNPHTTVLEYIHQQPAFRGKVAAFGAWEAFNRILNEPRCGFPVVAAFDSCGGARPSAAEKLINAMLKDSYKPFGMDECLDVFTHYEAITYLKTRKPRVLYIAYGETDEWAHHGQYKDYLDAAHQVDAWLQEIWNYVQSDPVYKNKTALLITVDHGRGGKDKNKWTDHGEKIADAHEIWFGVMGPGIPAKGELKTAAQLYQKQFAQTIASLLGLTFKADHPVAEGIRLK